METGKKIAAGILPICGESGKILLIQRGMNPSNPGKWACFGGKFEEGVDKGPKDTAKREFAEESKYIGKYNISRLPLYVNNNNHSLFYTYIGIFLEEFVPDLEAAGEAMNYGWFDIDNLPEDLLPGFREAVEKKQKTLKHIIGFYKKKC